MTPIQEILLSYQPFSDGIKNWCAKHPEFREGLKILYPENFITLGAIVLTHSPLGPDDLVIGTFAYDYRFSQKKFKQDFIVDIGGKDEEFVLYTALPSRRYSKYVQHINNFFTKYSQNKYYIDSHHLTLEQLPSDMRWRGEEAIRAANDLNLKGISLTPEQATDIRRKLNLK